MNSLKKWKLLKEEDISPSPWFPLYKQKLRLSNDKIVEDFYISKLGDVAHIIAITDNKKILMVRQYKHGHGDIAIETPAGRIKKGESPFICAKRELIEETGYTADKYTLIGQVCPSPTKDTTVVYGFIAQSLKRMGEPLLDSHEEIEVLELTLSEIKKLIKKNEIKGSDVIALLTIAEMNYPELFK